MIQKTSLECEEREGDTSGLEANPLASSYFLPCEVRKKCEFKKVPLRGLLPGTQ